MSETIAISPVEIAHLELAYAHTRIRHPRQIVAMADSLLRCGQLVPIVVVAAKKPDFVLIDGYQRVAAARRAGLDTLQAQIWPGAAGDALCRLLATDGARQFGIFEQAALLRELKTTHGMNQSRIAAQMGRHPSWVTRRLALIEGLRAVCIKTPSRRPARPAQSSLRDHQNQWLFPAITGALKVASLPSPMTCLPTHPEY